MYSQLKVRLRPNNQITVTCGNWRKQEIDVSQSPLHDFDALGNQEKLFAKKDEIIGQAKYYQAVSEYRKKNEPPLDIIQKSQRSRKPPLMRLNRPKNFTRFSGQRLREAGAAVDIACNGDTRFCHEVTLTLPANHEAAFIALAAYSGYVINRLFQPIRRKYGEMCLWFFVWEYQKRGALHIHICIYHPDECEGLYIGSQLIEQWHKILCDLCILADCDMFCRKNKKSSTPRYKHQHHTAPIKKAVGAYFSKYAGKEESKQSWYCQKYPVSRFWGSCKAIKEIIKAHSLEFNFDYGSNEKDCEWKYSEIIDRIVSKLSVVSVSQYSFLIQLNGSHVLNRYQNGRKILSNWEGKKVAEGERLTFYFEQSQFLEAMEVLREECEFF